MQKFDPNRFKSVTPCFISVTSNASVQPIFVIRGQKVMIDIDLANLYGVLTKRLNELRPVQVSIQIVKAFIRLRELLVSHKDLAQKLIQLEKRYDHQFKIVFDAIHKRMTAPTPPPKRRIGF